uniref:Uncharacterized protein n=1 Tax=Daphnia galeata TaxID=27404 RepID=A0A8J2RKN8_9CRUS|nr:unnamed protein product [Daphnia galeata]
MVVILRALFQLVGNLTVSSESPVLPDRPCMEEVVDDLSKFFSSKISTIRSNLDGLAESTSSHTLQHEQSFLQLHEENYLLKFRSASTAEVTKLIESSPTKSCSLDPLPTQLLKNCLVVLVRPITDIINLSLSTGAFLSSLKHGIITPLLKKPNLDRNGTNQPREPTIQLRQPYSPYLMIFSPQQIKKMKVLLFFSTCPLHSTQSITKYCSRDCPTVSVFLELPSTAQGSVLGSPLFLMYVTPFAEATTTEGGKVSQFSDDKQARSSFALKDDFSSQSQCRTRLGCWFEKTDAWLTINRVQLNIPKSTIIYTYNTGKGSTTRHINSNPLQILSSLVQPFTTACYLGVIINTQLTMEAQVMKTSRAANFHLSRINKIRRFLDFSSVKCVVNALVLSRLDYCNSLYLNLPSSLLKRLQRVQNAAIRTIFNLQKREHVSIHRQSLRWLEIADRAKLKVACRELRSGDKNLLICKSFRLILFGKRAFSCAAPFLWNSLPDPVRQAPNLNTFSSLRIESLLGTGIVCCQYFSECINEYLKQLRNLETALKTLYTNLYPSLSEEHLPTPDPTPLEETHITFINNPALSAARYKFRTSWKVFCRTRDQLSSEDKLEPPEGPLVTPKSIQEATKTQKGYIKSLNAVLQRGALLQHVDLSKTNNDLLREKEDLITKLKTTEKKLEGIREDNEKTDQLQVESLQQALKENTELADQLKTALESKQCENRELEENSVEANSDLEESIKKSEETIASFKKQYQTLQGENTTSMNGKKLYREAEELYEQNFEDIADQTYDTTQFLEELRNSSINKELSKGTQTTLDLQQIFKQNKDLADLIYTSQKKKSRLLDSRRVRISTMGKGAGPGHGAGGNNSDDDNTRHKSGNPNQTADTTILDKVTKPIVKVLGELFSREDEKSIPTFKGKSTDKLKTEWLKAAEHEARNNDWDEEQKLRFFSDRLKGEALEWHDEMPEDSNDFEALCNHLIISEKILQNKESNEDKELTAVIAGITHHEKQQDDELTQQKLDNGTLKQKFADLQTSRTPVFHTSKDEVTATHVEGTKVHSTIGKTDFVITKGLIQTINVGIKDAKEIKGLHNTITHGTTRIVGGCPFFLYFGRPLVLPNDVKIDEKYETTGDDAFMYTKKWIQAQKNGRGEIRNTRLGIVKSTTNGWALEKVTRPGIEPRNPRLTAGRLNHYTTN